MNRKLGLSRDQYDKFIKDHDSMEQFEVLFEQTNSDHDLLTTPILVISGSSYSLAYWSTRTLLVNSTVNPFPVTLPPSTGEGYEVDIVNISSLSSGLVKIIPNSGDAIGPLAINVSAYLQNVGLSGLFFSFQHLKIKDTSPGIWEIVVGQFVPEPGSVDSAGSQYYLGKYIRLPPTTGNRTVVGSVTLSAAWVQSGAITGTHGIPSGARAIKARVQVNPYAVAAGYHSCIVFFSDVNSVSADVNTAMTVVTGVGNGGSSGVWPEQYYEVDILLNSSGKFYYQGTAGDNNTLTSSRLNVYVLGYFMGD